MQLAHCVLLPNAKDYRVLRTFPKPGPQLNHLRNDHQDALNGSLPGDPRRIAVFTVLSGADSRPCPGEEAPRNSLGDAHLPARLTQLLNIDGAAEGDDEQR